MKIGKRQVLVVTITFVLCLAVYLNWRFTNLNVAEEGTLPSSSEKILGEAALVDSPQKEVKESSYFVEARLNRQKTRDAALATLKSIIDNDKSDKATKEKATQDITNAARYIDTEGKIENLIKAKGFENALAIVSEETATIVVQKAELANEDIIVIKDIVSSESKLKAEKISIIPVK